MTKKSTLADDLLRAHQSLVHLGLVCWTSGNISVRLSQKQFLIKPSGVRYSDLTEKSFIQIGFSDSGWNFDGRPSTDTPAHVEIYRAMPEINSIIHTHSPSATAWAIRGLNLPCASTEMADIFGNPVPCIPYAEIGGVEMGKQAAQWMTREHVGAVLLKSHGVITVGKSIDEALKRAVYLEHAAKTMIYASAINHGVLQPLTREQINSNHERYKLTYGQSA